MIMYAPGSRNIYEDFVVETDILFFKTGSHSLVSFHGKNYNIKKRMSADRMTTLLSGKQFYNVGGSCYVNVDKITEVEQGIIYFGEKSPTAKVLRIPRWKQEPLKRFLASSKQPVS